LAYVRVRFTDYCCIGAQDTPGEGAVLVVLDLPPRTFDVNPALTLFGLGSWPAGDVLATWLTACRGVVLHSAGRAWRVLLPAT
jgi:hypothetical protein